MTHRKYIVKNIEPTSEYLGIVYTQKVEIIFNNKTCWLEDNLMLVNKAMKILPENILPRVNVNGVYKSEKDIPLDKISFTFRCTIKDFKFANYNGVDYFIDNVFSKDSCDDKIWLSIYLRDITLI